MFDCETDSGASLRGAADLANRRFDATLREKAVLVRMLMAHTVHTLEQACESDSIPFDGTPGSHTTDSAAGNALGSMPSRAARAFTLPPSSGRRHAGGPRIDHPCGVLSGPIHAARRHGRARGDRPGPTLPPQPPGRGEPRAD